MIGTSLFHLAALCAAIILVAEVPMSEALSMPLSRLEVYKGEEIYLECTVENLGGGTVTWLKGSNVLAIGETVVVKDSRISVQRPYSYTWNVNIERSKLSDQGLYTCRVNSDPPQSGTVRITVVEDN